VSNFEQIANPNKYMWHRYVGHLRGCHVELDQFWQYAKEAMLWACDAKNDKDKKGLFELAPTWTQAALQERASVNRQTG
jgi:hypothetical protein